MSNFARKFKKQSSYEPPKEVKMLNALRTAAHALQQYAKGTSWAIESETGRVYWLGDGDGPKIAEDALGIKRDVEREKLLMEIYRPKTEG